ncbi:MAG TPA: DUF5995 family protein [Kofleriaceae bacterium]|nr:DUF5995 family protein [Kofleriaceae bacterium]
MNVPTLSAEAEMSDVIAALQEVGAQLTPDDGFHHFNSIYLLVTQGVADRVTSGSAHDPAFLVRLDATFCQLYLDALAAGEDGAPRAWQPMLSRRYHRGISGMRFAVAGMNAHINRDLAVALDAACRRVGGTLEDGDARHQDFRAVDDLLGALMAKSKAEVQDRMETMVDDAMGPVDDLLEHWSITHARALAWDNGLHLHRLRDQPSAAGRFLRGVDRTAGLIGRLLLL